MGSSMGRRESLTLFIQQAQPQDSGQRANWLPAPDGSFALELRMY
jgi:hypothetical protein